MEQIIDWCNHNQGFISMILTIITILIYIFVMYKSNKNAKEIAQEQIKFQ